MPHSSYTLAEINCYGNCNLDTVQILTGLAFKGDVVTTGQTAQSMCFATTLTTAKEILDTGIIPISLFTNNQVNNWFTPRSALLRAFQIYWSGYTGSLSLQEPMTLIVYNPSLNRFLTSVTVHQLMSNHVDEEKKVVALTAFNRLYLDHCWTTGALEEDLTLRSIESRTGFGKQLPFTAKDLIESLQVELNCNKIFWSSRQRTGWPLYSHSEPASADIWRCQQYRWGRLPTAQEGTDHTAKVDVKITGLPVGTEEVTVTVSGH